MDSGESKANQNIVFEIPEAQIYLMTIGKR